MKFLLKVKIYLFIWYFKNYYGYTKVSARLLYAQAWHETGNFTSAVFLQNKNLFGMRLPKKRQTFATGSNLNHATFKSHFDSVRDYFKRQKNFRIPNVSDEQYMTLTQKSGYAEDKNYIRKWKHISKTVNPPINITFLLVFFLVIIFIKLLISSVNSNKIKQKKYNYEKQQVKHA